MSQKNENTYSKHDANTRRALAELLPNERCALDGLALQDPVRLRCGQVYCRLCLRDLELTALLVDQRPACKVCSRDFVGVQPDNMNNTMADGDAHSQEQPSGVRSGTLGEQARNVVMGQGSPTVPWMPQARQVSVPPIEYTRNISATLERDMTEDAEPPPEASTPMPLTGAPEQPPPPHTFINPQLEHHPATLEGRTDPAADDVDFEDFLNNFDFERNPHFEQTMLLWDPTFDPSFGDFASLLESAAEPSHQAQAASSEYASTEYTPPFTFAAPVASPFARPGLEGDGPQQVLAVPSAHTTTDFAPPPTFDGAFAGSFVNNGFHIDTPGQGHIGGPDHTPTNFTPSLTFGGSFPSPFIDPGMGLNTSQQIRMGSSQYLPAGYTPPSAFLTPESGLSNYHIAPTTELPRGILRDEVIDASTQDSIASPQPLYPPKVFNFNTPPYPPTPHSPVAQVPSAPPFHQPIRDISILAGERFCFKGVLKNEAEMKAVVLANGGAVTKGGFKHTTYGVVGGKWKPTQSWVTNKIVVLNEDGFWELLRMKTEEARDRRESARGGSVAG